MQLVEVSGDGRYLSSERGFLVVNNDQQKIGKVPLDNILGVIGAGHGIVLSQNLLVRLARCGIPYVVCDNSFSPLSVAWPLIGRHDQTKVVRSQLEARLPLKKRLWQSLVREKITMQARVLEQTGVSSALLMRLASKVKSGDPDNLEAQAARSYWRALFGRDFRRSRNGKSPNDLLNYGYTVVRSAVARSVVGCGLHPSVGLCHRNQYNSFVLVDDLLEPFRPYIDLKVKTLSDSGFTLCTESKQALVEVLHFQCSGPSFAGSLLSHIQNLVRSLSQSFKERSCVLVTPRPTGIELDGLRN